MVTQLVELPKRLRRNGSAGFVTGTNEKAPTPEKVEAFKFQSASEY